MVMKAAKWACLALLCAIPFLNGCSGFWDEDTSGSTTPTTTLSSGVFYVLNVETSQIVAYYVSSGTLTKINTYTTPATPITLTVAPGNEYLYLSTVNGIYAYTISSNGTLNLASSTAISSDQAYTMQVDSTGAWLVEAVSGEPYAYAIPLDTTTGLNSTSMSEQYITLPSAATAIQQLTISPDNNYVFVAMGSSGTEIISFIPGNTNPFGSMFNIQTYNSSGAALSVAVDPSSRLLYIGETAATSGSNSGGLRVFKYASLPSIAEISGSPFASGGLAPYSILPISTGSYVYVANRQTSSGSTGVIKGFTVASSSSVYTLTALSSTASAGTHTTALAEDSTKQFVFAVSEGGSYDLTGYVFDTTTSGLLDKVIQSTTGTDPVTARAIAAMHY